MRPPLRLAFALMAACGFLWPASVELSSAPQSAAQAMRTDCNPVLAPDIETIRTNKQVAMAYLKILNKDNFDETKHDFDSGATVYGIPMHLGYDDFNQSRSSSKDYQYFKLTEQQSLSLLRQTVADAKVKSWTACVLKDAAGASITLTNESAQGATATFKWVGTLGDAKPFKVSVQGGTIDGLRELSALMLQSGGTQTKRIARTGKDDIYLQINGAGVSDDAASMYPPPLAPPPPRPSLAVQMNEGKQILVTFDPQLPGGNIGTIYPNRTFTVTYNQGRQSWTAQGPSGVAGTMTSVEYCETGCQGHMSQPHSPLSSELIIWNVLFTFDDDGNLSYNGKKVGRVVVH